jgi:alpha-1,2-mannosyltransferase
MLRDASWLSRRRLRDYSTMLIAGYSIAAIWALTGPGIHDPLGRPVGTDFLSFWTVSSALHDGHARAIYAPDQLAALEAAIDPGVDGFYAWAYPPIALLLVYPLALLPYLWSLAGWLALGLGGYLSALWRIWPRPLTIWAGIAFPAVFVTLGHGQNGLLTAALLGWALLLLPGRPGIAGVLIGLLTFKPQLGLVVPLALAAGGYWRTIVLAGVTAIGLAIISFLLFPGSWSDFLGSLPFARSMLELGLVPYYKMQSVFAAARLLGFPMTLAYGLQAFAAAGAAAVAAWVWRQPTRQELKNAVLMAAAPLATPFVLDYDLTLLAFPAAWLVVGGLRSRALPWERVTLAGVFVTPLISRASALMTHVLIAPAAEVALLLILVARIRAELAMALPFGQSDRARAEPAT